MSDPVTPLSSVVREEASRWWLKLQGPDALSDQDEQDFERWVSAGEHARALRECSETWDMLASVAHAPELVARRAQALEALRLANRRRWAKPVRLQPVRVALMAALILVSCVTLAVWLYPSQRPLDVKTTTGERRAMLLADGSRLSMDAETRVTVDMEPTQRRVHVDEGRARFDVAYEPERPFTVEAGGRIVVATGTSFSTELINGALHVIVYEGKVVVLNGAMPDHAALLSLKRHPTGRALSVERGQELVSDDVYGTALRHDKPGSSGWEAGQLEFVDQPLGDAVAQLNRNSKQVIEVSDARAAAIRVNGLFKAGNSAAFVDAVAELYPIDVDRRSANITKIRYHVE